MNISNSGNVAPSGGSSNTTTSASRTRTWTWNGVSGSGGTETGTGTPTLSKVSGAGSFASNKVSYDNNTSTSARSTVIRATIDSVTKDTTVTQNAGAKTYSSWGAWSIGRRVSGNDTAWSFTMTNLGAAFTGLIGGVYKNGFRIRVTSFSLGGTARYYLTSNKPVDLTLDSSPYYNSNSANKDKQIKISAYACRAYEGIYNAYIRDNRNNPYYVNGQVQYNKWIPTYDGGADQNIYELHYANWEKDFLTTAVQSPQQGTAPLVGITTYTETVETTSDDGIPVTRELSRIALVDEDGKKYQVSFD